MSQPSRSRETPVRWAAPQGPQHVAAARGDIENSARPAGYLRRQPGQRMPEDASAAAPAIDALQAPKGLTVPALVEIGSVHPLRLQVPVAEPAQQPHGTFLLFFILDPSSFRK